MKNSYLLQSDTRSALTGRDVLSPPTRRTALTLMLALVFAAFLAAGGVPVLAQEAATPAATVNINTADAHTLATTLKGVGQARATEIVRYREAYGPFASADELTEVKGIGQSTLDMNRKLITLE